jgi:hypothetical protein
MRFETVARERVLRSQQERKFVFRKVIAMNPRAGIYRAVVRFVFLRVRSVRQLRVEIYRRLVF